jgi:hypothetical protein
MWAVSWEEVADFERPTHYHRMTTVIAFSNDIGEYFLNILPRSWSMDIDYSAGGIIGGLEDVYDREGRNPHQRKVALHFDNALMHNTRMIMGQLEQSEFKRIGHPPHGPDLACLTFSMALHYDQMNRSLEPIR